MIDRNLEFPMSEATATYDKKIKKIGDEIADLSLKEAVNLTDYMKDEYGFDLRDMLPMLKRWNRLDPPGEHEHWRNERIFELQGTRNRFIDNFHLGNTLR